MDNKTRIDLFRNVTDGYKERSKYINTSNEINLKNAYKNYYDNGGSKLIESIQSEERLKNTINLKDNPDQLPPIGGINHQGNHQPINNQNFFHQQQNISNNHGTNPNKFNKL